MRNKKILASCNIKRKDLKEKETRRHTIHTWKTLVGRKCLKRFSSPLTIREMKIKDQRNPILYLGKS